jgi:hypothetical protein
MPTHTITRLYDDAGEARFVDTAISLDQELAVPPAEPLSMAVLGRATMALLVGAAENWRGEVAHPAPARQLMIALQGVVEITAGQETRRFTPGDVLLMEDTTGRGHQTRVVRGGAVLFVQLA